jgi:hypothetical protein
MPPDPGCPICENAVTYIEKMAVMHTKQDAVIEQLKTNSDMLVDIKTSLEAIKIAAVKSDKETAGQISDIKLKIKPWHLGVGVGGVGVIHEIIRFIHYLVGNKP